MDDGIQITDQEKEDIEGDIVYIQVDGKYSLNYAKCAGGFSLGANVSEVGYEKTKKHLRSMVYYQMQQVKKDVESEYALTKAGNIPAHSL